MDRLIYVAMTGAKHILSQQATVSQNLANVTTSGFRAQVDAFRSVPVISPGMATRAYVVDATVGTDFRPGVIQTTDRDLDLAINGKGWIAVQGADGKEAYTRYGSLMVNANGLLQTRNGLNVLSGAGTLSIPPDSDITVAKDGTVSVLSTIGAPNQISEVGRIKLVNPPEENLVRGDDGLFHLRDGGVADVDESIVLHSGGLESSNVNASEALVNMIALARQFDLHMKLLQKAEQNDAKSAQILSQNG
jgi:flagellar basal-body rod protein FlgF